MILHIGDMLRAQKEHLSFHTPGHKRAGEDITELSYSDCLLSPSGVIKAAEEDVARILGADKSFLLTDGSTSGIFSMLYALRVYGAKRVAAPVFSHPSVFHAAEVLGLKIVPVVQKTAYGLPVQPSVSAAERALSEADALLLTSPDYYGNFPDLKAFHALCRREGKPLLIDGAHGAHLHFCAPLYAGTYADMWVDGVHKSLPARTQGAVVSAKTENFSALLREGVIRFRTTSPSYPIMASVEYAVKYPRNLPLERASEEFKLRNNCVKNADWTKILVPFGEKCDEAQTVLEEEGIFPEFNDGNYILFYLSPATPFSALETLERALRGLARGEVNGDAPAGHIPMYTEAP